MKTIIALLMVSLPAFSPAYAADKVGIILPMTGDFGYFGEDFRHGVAIAVDDLKTAGIKVPELIFEDDKCLAKQAVTAFRRLADQEKVSLIVGPACSASIQSVSPIARNASLPVLFLLDTGESVSSLPDPLYSFGFDPPKMAQALADNLYRQKLKNVGIITEDEEYSVLISRSFEEKFNALGGTVKASESIPLNSADFRSIITKVLSKKPDAVFYSSAYQAGTFLKQLRLLAPKLPVYGNDTMCAADTVNSAQTSANGARCANVVLDESLAEVKAFQQAVEGKFGKTPSSLFYAALGYDSVRLILKELKLPPMPGKSLLGVESRSQNGMYDITPSILEIENGKMLPVSDH